MSVPPPPPPPPPPPGMPPGAYGGQPMAAQPQNGLGTASLVLGIVGLVLLCGYGVGLILSILAIIFGKMGLTKADQGLATNRSQANAGFIMGIIGTILGVIIVIALIIIFLVAASGANAMN